MLAWFWIFIGGGLGSLVRYGIAKWLFRYHFVFPAATLVANAISCLILGWLLHLSMRSSNETWKWFWMVGFCGGFSTFSTFTGETFELMQNGHLNIAFANVIISVIICLICLFLGFKLGSWT
jgi:CrcB protein